MGLWRRAQDYFATRRRRHANECADSWTSVVLLLRRPKRLSEQGLRSASLRAWHDHKQLVIPVDSLPEPQAPGKRLGVAQSFLLRVRGHRVNVLTSAQRYGSDPGAEPPNFTDAEQQTRWLEHGAWVSVDFVSNKKITVLEKLARHQFLSRLAAELIDDGCLGLLVGRTLFVGESLDEWLRIVAHPKGKGDSRASSSLRSSE